MVDKRGGGGIVNQLRKSYSLSDLTDNPDVRADVRGLPEHSDDERDVVDRHLRRRHSPRRSASGSSRVDLYFPEVDIRQTPVLPHGTHVRSIEDVSSGYSSAEPLYIGQPPKLESREGLVRTASVGGSTTRSRTRTTRAGATSTKKSTTTTVPEDSEDYESDTETSEITVIRRMPQLVHASKSSQSSDESDISDFADTIGFPLPNLQTKDISSISSIHGNLTPIETQVSTTPVKQMEATNTEFEDTNSSSTKSSITIEDSANGKTSVKDEENKVSIETNEQIEAAVSSKIVEESNIESSLIVANEVAINNQIDTDISSTIIEKVETIDIKSSLTIVENKEATEKLCNIQIKVEKQPSEDVFEDTIDSNQTEIVKVQDITIEETDRHKPEDTPNEISNGASMKIAKKEECEDTGEYETLSVASASRGGKYNKHTAPVPPNESSTSNHEDLSLLSNQPNDTSNETHPIKATLVLKPGIIKSICPPANEEVSKTQIFVSHSPKTKRKSKHESPISRLMMLPKKIFGHKDGKHSSNEDLKRKSWHHDDSRSITPSSVEDIKLSKSDTEGSYEQLYFKNEATKNHEEKKMILRNLSHSPKQYRRKKREEKHYEDSD